MNTFSYANNFEFLLQIFFPKQAISDISDYLQGKETGN
jgi:hypothetical protein